MCSMRGLETDLKKAPGLIGGVRCTNNVCPTCGNDEYMFMTPGEIKAWERAKDAAIAAHGDPDYLLANGKSVRHIDLRSDKPRKKRASTP